MSQNTDLAELFREALWSEKGFIKSCCLVIPANWEKLPNASNFSFIKSSPNQASRFRLFCENEKTGPKKLCLIVFPMKKRSDYYSRAIVLKLKVLSVLK